MNTPPISTALPAASSNPGTPQTGASREPDAATPNFSSVLTRQQTSEAAPEKAVAASTDAAPRTADAQDAAPDAAEDTDEALVELATEQGLGLPQIALNIAAEAALAMAARRPGAVSAAPGRAEALAAALARGPLPAMPLDAAQAVTTPAAALAVAGAAKNDAAARTPMPAIELDTPAATTGKAIEIPAGFVAVQTTALPPKTELDLRKAPAVAGNARKNLAAAQALPADFTLAKTAAPDATALAADIASVSARASFAGASTQIDLSASQAGSITAANGTAGTTLLSANMGSVINTGTQAALPGIATPLQSPQWGAEFGRQFVSLTQGGHNMPHTAELRLDPPELGPLRISINISDNVAHAIFTSPHAAVRQTVENSLPQLQQLLAQAGISLGQTSVNDQGQTDQSFNESFGASRKATVGAANGATGDATGLGSGSPARSRAPDALVDTFA